MDTFDMRRQVLLELVTGREMAARMRVSENTVLNRARELGIGRKIGGCWLFLPEDELALVNGRRTG